MPRQSKRCVVGAEWAWFQQQANTSHQCPVFFVSDRIKSGKMNVEHCLTGEMVADFFTKPLQGAKFTKFRNLIMNVWMLILVSPWPRDQRSVLRCRDSS
jgi:hypothetical protein